MIIYVFSMLERFTNLSQMSGEPEITMSNVEQMVDRVLEYPKKLESKSSTYCSWKKRASDKKYLKRNKKWRLLFVYVYTRNLDISDEIE